MAEQGARGLEGRHHHISASQSKTDNEAVSEPSTKSRSGSTDQGKSFATLESQDPRLRASSPAVASGTSTPTPQSTETSQSQPPSQPIAASHIPATVPSHHRPPTHYTTSHSSSHSRSSEARRLEPPVTKHTLSELDVSKIIHNPKLRHDINFDPELHFRPNLDGEKGRRKQQKAHQFWETLEKQLNDFVNPETHQRFMEECGPGKDWCLPELLKAVKEIIQTLVPARDRSCLEEGLNVDLIMQQFYRGVADLEKLASWLSRVLKSHCAPMRDEWVDEMYRQLSTGNRESDTHKLVAGMRSLLSVLEAMKLDVANHQIRCLRPILIEDTIHFEQKFFSKKLNSGRPDRAEVHRWYLQANQELMNLPEVNTARPAMGEMTVFMTALSKIVMPSVSLSKTPHTFIFDEERIVKARSDIQDAVSLDVCMRMYEDLERLSRLQVAQAEADAIASANFNFNAPPSRPSSGMFTPTGSRPTSGVFSSASSAASGSPRTSGIFAAPPPTAAELKSKSEMVYNSLVALVQTAPHSRVANGKWAALAPEMALQIFRFVDAPQSVLASIEQKLTEQLTNTNNEVYMQAEQQYWRRLLLEISQRVKELKGVNCMDLFQAATSRPGVACSRAMVESAGLETRDERGLADVALRLAHLGILHWKVWAPIAYDTPMN